MTGNGGLGDLRAADKAKVVALNQAYSYNRFGAFNPIGMIYALERDVVPINGYGGLAPGNARLRPEKRPRPLVLVNVGDCLEVELTTSLHPTAALFHHPTAGRSGWTGPVTATITTSTEAG